MSLFSKLFGSNNSQNGSENKSRVESAAAVQGNQDDGELVAVIMAAVMNMLSVNASSGLQIKSIRHLGRSSPVWNLAGRDEYITSKF